MLNMLLLSDIGRVSYWSSLINLIVSTYFHEQSTTCILWNDNVAFHLDEGFSSQFVNIMTSNLERSLPKDVFNFQLKAKELQRKNLYFNALIMKLTVAIDNAHCENFIAFQEDIPKFAAAFRRASSYSEWRSQSSKFLFAYRKDVRENITSYFDDLLFRDQPNILVIEAENDHTNFFELKTNRFVGSYKENPAELLTINTFDASKKSFAYAGASLYPNKFRDLQGRELIFAAFDYRPFVVFDTNKRPQIKDYALDNPKGTLYVDGIEVRILTTYCERYNCSVEVDSSEKDEWGNVFENGTGTGLQGMVVSGKATIALGALYLWTTDHIDKTTFLGRSGVTCLVPKPARLTSWILPLKPFQATLWLVICFCIALEASVLFLTYRTELLVVLDVKDRNWFRSLWFGYTAALKIFISQPLNTKSVSLSVRIVLFSCFIIDIILTNTYGAGLATILTLPTLAEAPDSTERLHKFRIPWTGSSEDWIYSLDKSDESIIKDLVARFQIHSFDKLRELAKTENMGFIVERTLYGHFGNINYLTQESLDRLKLMIDDIYFTYTVGVVPRLWAFLASFDEFILNWHSAGLDEFWEMKTSAQHLSGVMQQHITSSVTETANDGPTTLDMANSSGILLIWGLGIAISALVFCGEILLSPRHPNGK